MRTTAILVVLVAALCSAQAIDTVPKLDVSKYLGRWYQMYADATIDSTIERHAYCVTADYGVINSTTISVFNSQRVGANTGPLKNITGTATIVDPSKPGQLYVTFPGVPHFGKSPNYWIIKLGPVNAQGQYDYSLVSDKHEVGLFVLARDPKVFMAKYNADVLSFLKDAGFTHFYDKPKMTPQQGCTYATPPNKAVAATAAEVRADLKTLVRAMDVPTVPELNVKNYIGRWYQMYGDLVIDETFEHNQVCITADYKIIANASIPTVSVLNAGRAKTPTGTAVNITGFATQPDASHPGSLRVHLKGTPTYKNGGNYWVVKLGPINQDGLYDYSIVTDKHQIQLYVLARNPQNFMKQYDTMIMAWLKNNGFDHFYNKPRKTLQSSQCIYPQH